LKIKRICGGDLLFLTSSISMNLIKRIVYPLLLLCSASLCLGASIVLQDLTGAAKTDGQIKGAPLETGQIPSQQWKIAGGEGVYFKDSALTFGSRGNYGKAYLEFSAEDEAVYKLRFQIKFRDASVSKLTPRAFNWYGGFGTQNEFVDYRLGAGLMFFYNSSYERNQLQVAVGSGLQGQLTVSTGYVVGRHSPLDWTGDVEIVWDGATATYWINGELVGTVPYSGPIGGLWFKGNGMLDSQDDLVMIRNLSVEKLDHAEYVSIPEPANMALWLSLSALCWLLLRR
jgi:hypothetical protein